MKRFAPVLLCVVVMVLGVASAINAVSYTQQQVLSAIFDGTDSVKFTFSGWVDALDISDETALTNTIHPILDLTHTTSGTPANGIGESIRFTQEVTSGNEIAMQVGVVAADVTAASEDFDFILYLMKAGAAMSEAFRVTSTGVLTLVGGTTLDNVTASTLTVTETNIGLTGATTVTGALGVTGAVTINDASADVDVRIESNGDENAIFVDGGNDRVGIFTAAPTVPFDVTGQTLITGQTDIVGDTSVTGDTVLTGGLAFTGCTIADGDATPDVDSCVVLTTSANTGATEITDLDNPVVGGIYLLIGGSATNSSTITDGGNFALSANWTASVDETLTLFVQADNDYIEVSRSTN